MPDLFDTDLAAGEAAVFLEAVAAGRPVDDAGRLYVAI